MHTFNLYINITIHSTVHALKILKMDPTVLFTHLKIILLQYFQFSVFNFSNNKFNPNGSIVSTIASFVTFVLYLEFLFFLLLCISLMLFPYLQKVWPSWVILYSCFGCVHHAHNFVTKIYPSNIVLLVILAKLLLLPSYTWRMDLKPLMDGKIFILKKAIMFQRWYHINLQVNNLFFLRKISDLFVSDRKLQYVMDQAMVKKVKRF